MIINKFDNPFGPAGSWTGIFLFIAGIIYTYFSSIGLILVISGAFIGFTYVSTVIDVNKRRVKHVHNLFGLIPIGRWIKLEYGMTIGLKKQHRGFRTITRGHSLDTHISDIRIILYSLDNKHILPLKKFNSIESAKKDIEIISHQLELNIV